jgi:hypothetical protein
MSGAVRLLPLYAATAWKEKTLPLSLRVRILVGVISDPPSVAEIWRKCFLCQFNSSTSSAMTVWHPVLSSIPSKRRGKTTNSSPKSHSLLKFSRRAHARTHIRAVCFAQQGFYLARDVGASSISVRMTGWLVRRARKTQSVRRSKYGRLLQEFGTSQTKQDRGSVKLRDD